MNSLQIRLNPQQSQILMQIAEEEGQAILKLVEQIIQEAIERRQKQTLAEKIAGFERIKQHRDAILARRQGKTLQIDVTQLLDEIREERDEQLFNNFIHRG